MTTDNHAVALIEQIADRISEPRIPLHKIVAALDSQPGAISRRAYKIIAGWMAQGCKYFDEVIG